MISAKTPAVSVILSVYNGGELLRPNGIDSVLKQTFQDFELVIVDDGSTDGSVEVIKKAAADDKRIKPIFLANNVGIARARNAGLAVACGKYMMVQDSTDISYPDRMQKQFDFMEANPDFAMVGGAMKIINLLVQEADDGKGKIKNTGDYLSGSRETISRYATDVNQIDAILAKGAMPSTHLVFFARMTALRKIGGYHPALPVAEDVDLFFRLSTQGKMVNLPDILADHIVDGNNSAERVPLWKATCAVAASRSYLARRAGKVDFMAGRETPPELEVLDHAANPVERIVMTQFIMGSLLWGFDREEYRKIFWQLLDELLAMENLPTKKKADIVSRFINDILNYNRNYYQEHFPLLEQLVKLVIKITKEDGGTINNLEALCTTIKTFLDSKEQDSAWIKELTS